MGCWDDVARIPGPQQVYGCTQPNAEQDQMPVGGRESIGTWVLLLP
jgi:hypothetical protein